MEEKNYGATDAEATTPLMKEDAPLIGDKPRRGRTAAVVVGTLCMAATLTKTQRYADLRASLRTPRGTPSVDWVYDLTVTQVRSRRLHFIQTTRGHETRSRVVSFLLKRPFGPFPVNTTRRSHAGPVLAADLRPEHAGDAALRALRADDVLGPGGLPGRGRVQVRPGNRERDVRGCVFSVLRCFHAVDARRLQE